MKKRLIPILMSTLLAAAMLAGSCEKFALPKLELSRDTVFAPLEGGSFDVTLTSNVRWSFESNTIVDWIYIDTQYGTSDFKDVDYPINLKIKANEGEAERVCTLKLSTMTLSRKLVVVQEGPPTDPGTSSQ